MKQSSFRPSAVYERLCIDHRAAGVAGIDEVGKGALAGPLVTCAVTIDPQELEWWEKQGLLDSKLLSEEKRERFSKELQQHQGVQYAFAEAEADVIDQEGIVVATKNAMRGAHRALQENAPKCRCIDHLLIDGQQTIPELNISQTAIVKGDMLCLSIAAASILAKVERDTLMKRYDTRYPEYGFCRHVGYGTKEHREAILQHGPCPIHRKTFLGNIIS